MPLHDTPFVEGPLVDHHCHGIVTSDLDRDAFEGMLNEASGGGRLGTSSFDSMVGLAVRRWCPPLLDLDPLDGADAYLTRRAQLGVDEVARRMLAATGTELFLVDTGYTPADITSPDQLAMLAGGTAREVVRLEVLAEAVLREGTASMDFAA